MHMLSVHIYIYIYIYIHHHFSDTTCLRWPRLICEFYRVKEHPNVLHSSPLLKKTCVRHATPPEDRRSGAAEPARPPRRRPATWGARGGGSPRKL